MTGNKTVWKTRPLRACLAVLLLGAGALGLSGCGFPGTEVDSFFDPSVTGYWEKTPTIMPVLDRLSAIEDEPAEYVQTSPILPGDLVPEIDTPRFVPGDVLEVKVRDFFIIGAEESFERQVDQRGYIQLPRLPEIRAQGRTQAEFTAAVENAIKTAQINANPVVAINIRTQRKQTFSIMGAVSSPGIFFIPGPEYRLLEGLGAGGQFNESIQYIYVVRQVPLSDAATGRISDPEPVRGGRRPTQPESKPSGERPKEGEDLNRLIQELTQPKPGAPKSPAMMIAESPAAPVRSATLEPPPIELPDPTKEGTPAPNPQSGGSGWVYVDGKWVKTRPGSAESGGVTEQNLVTQRVIKVPTGPLLAGAADVNIVLRPGDVVRAPIPKAGVVYVAGQVVRPGVYGLPTEGKLTLLRVLDAAGGLNNIAIPERIDITRVVGDGREATMRLDGRAIAERNQPDIFLKPDDRINVGTNLWATPLAVLRGGLRASYGFGFILDRNFAGEVFGVDRSLVNQ